MFGRLGNALPPASGRERQELVQAAARVLVQVGVPRRDQGNFQAMSDPEAKDSHISRSGNVYQVRAKMPELGDHLIPISAEQGVTVEAMVKPERSQTSPQFHGGEGLPPGHLRASATVNAKKWKLATLRKCGEFTTERAYTVGFVE